MTLHMTRWSPVSDLAAIEIDRLNRMFQSALSTEGTGGAWVPTDIHETPTQDLIITADLPSMKKEDIKVTFENDVLTIEGERKMNADVAPEAYHRLERSFGAFRRSFTLPASVDASRVVAAYQDGVLTITLPRREDTRPRQINVNG
jgi:HSP20 family protein